MQEQTGTKTLYILIRIPKSGTQSLREMVRRCLPDNRYFRIPELDITPPENKTLIDSFRKTRRNIKGMMQAYHAINEEQMWARIAGMAEDGDIISGHMSYGRVAIPGATLNHITLMRDPVERMISEYNYSREGYLQRNRLRKSYMKGRIEAAGRSSFSAYLEYLIEHHKEYQNPATAYITGDRHHPDPFTFLKENYFHFGILENMTLFSEQLSIKLGSTSAPENIWKNRTKTRSTPELSDRNRNLLNTLLSADIKLYDQTKAFLNVSQLPPH